MQKRITLLLTLLLTLTFCAAMADAVEEPAVDDAEAIDYGTMDQSALVERQGELLSELALVNDALGKKIMAEATDPAADDVLGRICDLFPDDTVACYIRDKLSKFSIQQTVTQEELDTFTEFAPSEDYDPVYDLTGISHLRNLTRLTFYTSNGWCTTFQGTELPDELYTLTKLEYLNLSCLWSEPLESISDKIGNLTNLKYLRLEHTKITTLPDSICQLVNLETLNVANTNLKALPENIGNLTHLKKLDISNTNIDTLPDSIWGLTLDELNMAGTGVK